MEGISVKPERAEDKAVLRDTETADLQVLRAFELRIPSEVQDGLISLRERGGKAMDETTGDMDDIPWMFFLCLG